MATQAHDTRQRRLPSRNSGGISNSMLRGETQPPVTLGSQRLDKASRTALHVQVLQSVRTQHVSDRTGVSEPAWRDVEANELRQQARCRTDGEHSDVLALTAAELRSARDVHRIVQRPRT